MKNKDKFFSIVTVSSILGTILIILFVLVMRIRNFNEINVFKKEANIVYLQAIKQNKEDIEEGFPIEEYSYYKAALLLNNKDTVNYIAEFDEETKKLDYLCIYNGKLKVIFEGEINEEIIEEAQIINSKKECEFRDER